MFKFYLNLDNEITFNQCYEVHKKQCAIVKHLGEDGLLDLGFFDNDNEAMAKAKEVVLEEGLDPTLVNGCLACMKAHHKR